MRPMIPTAALATVLLLAACGGGTTSPLTDGTPSTSTESPQETSDVDGDDPTTGADGAVDIDDFAYDPESTTVAAGTEVRWTNQDAALHSVTAGTPEAPEPDVFDLDRIEEAGQTVSHTFDEPGTYDYFCRYHDFMLGTVEVTA